jgi:hypothetical protein
LQGTKTDGYELRFTLGLAGTTQYLCYLRD